MSNDADWWEYANKSRGFQVWCLRHDCNVINVDLDTGEAI